jgi:hypothetical protein
LPPLAKLEPLELPPGDLPGEARLVYEERSLQMLYVLGHRHESMTPEVAHVKIAEASARIAEAHARQEIARTEAEAKQSIARAESEARQAEAAAKQSIARAESEVPAREETLQTAAVATVVGVSVVAAVLGAALVPAAAVPIAAIAGVVSAVFGGRIVASAFRKKRPQLPPPDPPPSE